MELKCTSRVKIVLVLSLEHCYFESGKSHTTNEISIISGVLFSFYKVR